MEYKTDGECSFSMKIEPKESLASIVSGRSSIPRDELHIQEGSNIGTIVSGFPEDISFTLKAVSSFGPRDDFIVGYIREPKLVYCNNLDRPLAINSLTLKRARDRFTKNNLYDSYEISVVSPPPKVAPKQDWGTTKFFTDRPRLGFGADFEDLLSYSDDIPEGELHVYRDSEHAKILRNAQELEYITDPCSVRLQSFQPLRWEDAYYSGPTELVFGDYPLMRIVYVNCQKTPLALKRDEADRNPFEFFRCRSIVRYVEIGPADKPLPVEEREKYRRVRKDF